MPSGYSSTPLAKKLGIKEGFTLLLYNEPENYMDYFTNPPAGLGVVEEVEPEGADFIHLFCKSFEELERVVEQFKPALKKNGLLWISWPKGSSKMKTDLKRDLIREHLLEIGLVDVKVAAINEDWSGLKFVYRVKDR